MRLGGPTDLGLYVRDRRRHAGLTQADLSRAASVSRRWLSDLEAGKATVEIGLVFRVLDALDLTLEASPTPEPDIDLEEHLRTLGRQW